MPKVLQKTKGRWVLTTTQPNLQDYLKTEEGEEVYQLGWAAMEEYVLSEGHEDYPVNPYSVDSIQHLAFSEACGDYEPEDEE